tara:strand:+ start:922 stop:1395 length:474 start_codon:yes stop_codon:yes gene_type:complete
MVHLGTVRYNNQTWKELDTYLETNAIKGCVYNVPIRITTAVPIKNPVIIFEMNNTLNKIMAIGLVENYLRVDKYYKIHKINNYNRYSYVGDHRIVRENFSKQEEMVFKAFDHMVFKGSSHMKRGQGVTCISEKKLKNYEIDGFPIDEFVYRMFTRRC